MRLRRLPPIFACFLCFAVSFLHATELEFVRVRPGWRNAEDFERISEYFTGREDPGKRVILRTQPHARAGFYYLVRVAASSAPHAGAKFVLHVITPASPEVKTYRFSTDVPARSTLFHLGLTGADWPNEDTHPVAWKLELLADDDRVLASEQSFLWSKPARE